MTSVYAPLARGVLAQARTGDGLETQLRPLTNALSVSYTISLSKYGVAFSATYVVENANVAPLLLYYQVAPPADFTINGNGFIVQPDQVTYTLRPIANRTLIGGPLLQGVPQVIWTYSVMNIDEFDLLIGFYNPQSTLVTITYPDENGAWVQRKAVMVPPTYGSRQTTMVYGVALTFLVPYTT